MQQAQAPARVEVWAMDEHRIGLKPILRRIWALKGTTVTTPVAPHYEWMESTLLCIRKASRPGFLLLPTINVEVFSRALAAFAQEVRAGPDKPIVLVLARAGVLTRSVAALLGGPQEKMARMPYLTEGAAGTEDEGLKALCQTIQLALFSQGQTLSHLGRDPRGVYRQAWEAIAALVEGERVDARLLEAMARNTLAVLGPAARRAEWRADAAQARNAATVRGDRNLAALLDAGGNPTGLGQGLQSVYASTWQKIVAGLKGEE